MTRVLAVLGHIDAQIIDILVDFLDLGGHIAGKLFLVADQLIDEILQLEDQVDRQDQGKAVIGDQF